MKPSDTGKAREIDNQSQATSSQRIDHVTKPPDNLGQQSSPSKRLTELRRTYADAVKYGPIEVDTTNRSTGDLGQPPTDKSDTPDYAELFKDIEGKTIQQIIALIPKDAMGYKYSSPEGFLYRWTDKRDIEAGLLTRREWAVRAHAPNPYAPEGSNSRNRWIARVQQSDKYMDRKGQFYRENQAFFHHDTHIPIGMTEI